MDNLDKYDKLVELVSSLKEDYEKNFIKGNKAAGTRVRKQAQEIIKLLKEVRNDVQAKKTEA